MLILSTVNISEVFKVPYTPNFLLDCLQLKLDKVSTLHFINPKLIVWLKGCKQTNPFNFDYLDLLSVKLRASLVGQQSTDGFYPAQMYILLIMHTTDASLWWVEGCNRAFSGAHPRWRLFLFELFSERTDTALLTGEASRTSSSSSTASVLLRCINIQLSLVLAFSSLCISEKSSNWLGNP